MEHYEQSGHEMGGGYPNYPPMGYSPEANVDNIVAQIDPQNIVDNFNHALKGEYFNKETGEWKMNASGKPLVNDSCRGWIISYLSALMNNASTMGTINEKQFSHLMEGVIRSVKREFVCNLEYFGFVKPSEKIEVTAILPDGRYIKIRVEAGNLNRGIPNSNRMDSIAEMIYQRAFLTYSRSLSGMESRKIFSSLSMTDQLNYGQAMPQQNWVSKMFG